MTGQIVPRSKQGKAMSGVIHEDFPARLRVAIKGKFTQQSLASEIGYSVSGVKKWFSGHTDPSWSAVVLIARTCGVSLDWLAGRELNEASKPEIDVETLSAVIREVALNASERQEVLSPQETAKWVSQLYRVSMRMK
ncbi:helix-turn-helix domain-containing protein [Thalassospira xianhensis]|uniref:helix-turn-helix domain-containing protein n=1 Tax=Thalassospira xianhensis TaxID=478503 RepID=UPI000DEDD503|nr:helix-turn-helix domain-containing protein [Thalassospira xianhensis]